MSVREKIGKLKQRYDRTYSSEEKMQLIDLIGEYGDEAFDTLMDIINNTYSNDQKQKAYEHLNRIVKKKRL